MIQADDVFKFLKNGMHLGAISIGMSTHEIKEKYGEPTSITGSEDTLVNNQAQAPVSIRLVMWQSSR